MPEEKNASEKRVFPLPCVFITLSAESLVQEAEVEAAKSAGGLFFDSRKASKCVLLGIGSWETLSG